MHKSNRIPLNPLFVFLVSLASLAWSSASAWAQSPVIVTHPLSQTVPAGATVAFTVVATGTGTGTLSYQWKKNSVNISGQTSATLTINSAASADAGNYSVDVSNSIGMTTSNSATLTVSAAALPTITSPPVSQNVSAGANVTFSVAATGSAPLSFQWMKNSVNIAGQTSATLTLNSVTSADAGAYSVKVSNAAGAPTSAVANLTVSAAVTAPQIVQQPSSQPVSAGANVTLSVTATGSGNLTFQWKKNGVDIAGQTSATLTLNSVTTADAGNYSVTVSNSAGATASANATLTVGANVAPKISVQPISQTVSAGGDVSLTVTASGTAPLTFIWKRNGIDVIALNGDSSSTLTLKNVTSADAGDYSVVVSNAFGSDNSATANVKINALQIPTISLQPLSQTVSPGATITLSVAATGSGNLKFQWKKNGVDIAGQTGATLTLNNVTTADSGNYSVTISNDAGTTTSASATLTVGASAAPQIVLQPLSQNVSPGGSVTLSVTASGSGNLKFQWKKNGVDIAGQTGATLTLNSVTSADAGNYSVTVSNDAGATANASANITVGGSVSPGLIDLSFLPKGGVSNVTAIAVQSDGKVVIAGSFNNVNGVLKNHIARLNADGTLDVTYNASANGDVLDTQLQGDGKLLIAGKFTTVNGTSDNYVARLNADGTVDTSFQAGTGANAPVQSVSLTSDGKIILTGDFTAFNGTSDKSVVRLNSNGSLDTSFNTTAGPNGPVADAEVQSNGKIVIGGSFTSVGGTARDAVARLNTDGSLDTSFNVGAGAGGTGKVTEVEVQGDGKILIGGSFSTVNGVSRPKLARLNSDGSVDTSFDAKLGANSQVLSLEAQGNGKALVGGNLSIGGSSSSTFLAQLNSDGSVDSSVNLSSSASSPIATIEVQSDGKILIGGDNLLARLNTVLQNLVPRIVGLVRNQSQGSVQLSIATEAGKNYVVETKTDLGAQNWLQVSNAAGDGSVKTVTDASATGNVRFYRVRAQ